MTSETKNKLRLKSTFSLGLALLTAYAAFNSLWSLASGARSEYYAAIAKSMSLSFSNWFFGAFDPAGTVTLDKIPGSYWVPAIFVKIFGFSTWAVDAPNALAVIAATLITVFAVRQVSGNFAGLMAGAIVATTPILIAVSRSNQPQSFFVLALAITFWASIKALKSGRRRDLITAGLFVAMGFNFYMLESWAVWPALIVGWLSLNPKTKTWGAKTIDLLIAGSVSLVASIIWPTIVWLIPASNRPYIGGTYHNNPFEMIFGYNGLGRFGATSSEAGSTFQTFTPPFAGEASPFRLFNDQLIAQIGWLIPAAIVAAIAIWFLKTNRAISGLLTTWFVTFAVMFSLVAGMHQFYTSALAIPMAALIAVAFAEARKAKRLAPQVALIVVAVISALFISNRFTSYFGWVYLVQLAIAVGAITLIVLARQKFTIISLVAAVAALTLTPAVWASDAMNNPSSINPVAGSARLSDNSGMPNFGGRGGPNGMPNFGGQGGPNGMPNFDQGTGKGASQNGPDFMSSINKDLVAFLKTNAGTGKYQLAAFDGLTAAPYITQTDLSVLPIGGFNGSDQVPTLQEFVKLVNTGELKYVLNGGMGGMGSGQGAMNGGQGSSGQQTETSSSQIDTWVSTNCQTVDYLTNTKSTDAPQASNNTATTPNFFGGDSTPVLYQCSAKN